MEKADGTKKQVADASLDDITSNLSSVSFCVIIRRYGSTLDFENKKKESKLWKIFDQSKCEKTFEYQHENQIGKKKNQNEIHVPVFIERLVLDDRCRPISVVAMTTPFGASDEGD